MLPAPVALILPWRRSANQDTLIERMILRIRFGTPETILSGFPDELSIKAVSSGPDYIPHTCKFQGGILKLVSYIMPQTHRGILRMSQLLAWKSLLRRCHLGCNCGQTAYWSHKHWHETMDGGFLKYLDELDDETFKIISDFLVKVETFLKLRIESDA